MKTNFHKIGNKIYSEYVAKAGDDLKKLAKDYLGDEKQMTDITHKRDTSNQNSVLIQGAISNAEIILIPAVSDSIKNKNLKVRDELNKLDSEASNITMDEYYIRRKTLLSTL